MNTPSHTHPPVQHLYIYITPSSSLISTVCYSELSFLTLVYHYSLHSWIESLHARMCRVGYKISWHVPPRYGVIGIQTRLPKHLPQRTRTRGRSLRPNTRRVHLLTLQRRLSRSSHVRRVHAPTGEYPRPPSTARRARRLRMLLPPCI